MFCVIIFVLMLISKSGESRSEPSLLQQSLLYGVLDVSQREIKNSTNKECYHQLSSLKNGIDNKEMWALKMLDSSGTPGSGFIWGNNYWLGSIMECRDLRNRVPIPLASTLIKNYSTDPNSWPEYPIEFYMATFSHNSTIQVHIRLPNENLISVGLCLPEVCLPTEISRILRILVKRRTLTIQQTYEIDLQLETVRSLRQDDSWLKEPKFVVFTLVMLTLIGFVIAGTLYDTLVWQPKLRRSKQHLVEDKFVNNNNNNYINKSYSNKDNNIRNDDNKNGEVGGFLKCFSIYTNTAILLNTSLGPDSVGSIHGIRFISMVWILLVHPVYFMSDYADNKPYAYRLGDGIIVQLFSNATISVDTFFVISGFLVSYLYFKGKEHIPTTKKKCNSFCIQAKTFSLMLLKRFFRLTPVYTLVVYIVNINMSWRNRTSVFHMTERADRVCSKYWWRNLMYINNFFNREEMCMSWSWYLSNDMQFYVVGSFLLILSSSWMTLSASILVTLLIASSILTGFISYSYSYVPTLDQQFAMVEILYDPPWVRIGPYLVGLLTGYVVERLNGELPLKKGTIALIWFLVSICNMFVLFGLYNRDITPLTAAFYVGLSRTLWGLGVAWLIIACRTHHASFIDRILSFPAWIPLSRLTYCVYLLNPLIINSVYLGSESAMHIGFLHLCAVSFGFLVISYICAYAISLLIETPTILLIKQFENARPKMPN